MQAVIQLAQQHSVIAHRFYGAEGKVMVETGDDVGWAD